MHEQVRHDHLDFPRGEEAAWAAVLAVAEGHVGRWVAGCIVHVRIIIIVIVIDSGFVKFSELGESEAVEGFWVLVDCGIH